MAQSKRTFLSKHTYSVLLTIAALLAAFGTAHAGVWEDEIRVTNDLTEQWDSVLTTDPNDSLYALWSEESSKQYCFYMIKSDDKGGTWTAPALVLGPAMMINARIAADANGLHLAFIEYDGVGSQWLCYTKSIDGGQTFFQPVKIGSLTGVLQAELHAGGGRLVIYAKDMNSGSFVYVSDDGGATWAEHTLLPGYKPENPDFLLRNGVIHVAFCGFIATPIAYSRSLDGGATWTTPTDVSSGAGPHSQLPSIAFDGKVIHIGWEDDRDGYFNIMYSRSDDGGATWSKDLRINDTYYGARTKLLADRDGVHIVWCQYHGQGWPANWGSGDYGIIRSKRSTDAGLTWSGEFRVSQNDFIPPLEYPDKGANYVGLCAYSDGLCAHWRDKRDGNIDIYIRNCHHTLAASDDTLSLGTGGTIDFDLTAGLDNAGRSYILAGSISGTEPGTLLPGGLATIPLNRDFFTNITLKMANGPIFQDFKGKLDGAGSGTAALVATPPMPGAVGVTMHYAFCLANPFDFVSNPVDVTFVP